MSQVQIAQKEPYAVTIEAGKKYAWCACGRSAKQPYCDGAHKGTNILPVLFEAESSETVYLCGCKHTKGHPFCDGSHNQLP
ncbi:MAG: CDGSH iron-sulfur domain-containing protein [Acidobacteria bacterium]|nr:CDGSH iron-sulfur domain-containing protein [Acidobacteriota bacterium]